MWDDAPPKDPYEKGLPIFLPLPPDTMTVWYDKVANVVMYDNLHVHALVYHPV